MPNKLLFWWKNRGKKKKAGQQSLSGIDTCRTDSYDQTALDLVRRLLPHRSNKGMKQILSEAVNSIRVQAIRDHFDPCDPECLSFREGEHITVLEQCSDGRWRGVILEDNFTSRSGYFPATAVAVVDRHVGGMSRPSKASQVKKVAPPTVPDFHPRLSGSSFGSGYSSLGSDNRSSFGTDDGSTPTFKESTSPCDHSGLVANFQQGTPSPSYRSAPSFTFPTTQSQNAPAVSQSGSPHYSGSDKVHTLLPGPHYQHQISLEDQGIDLTQSPGRDSPGSSDSSTAGYSSSGCRNSTTSLDSGRASSSAYDGRPGHPYFQPPNPHRLSGQSYESSGSLRQSYHSSSSSLGSMERPDDNGIISTANIAHLVEQGLPDIEILNTWLTDLHFGEYYSNFVQAGYDMATISRMTPEDLTAIGITRPAHRKKLKAEISKLNISDGLPDFIPESVDSWLGLLRLEEYAALLHQQGYHSVEQVTDITWEDLEEIGIRKLGHQKKITLAIKRVNDILTGKRVAVSPVSPVIPQHLQAQEIAIASPQHSPVHEPNVQLPQFQTFQQPPAAHVPGVRWDASGIRAHYGPPGPIMYHPDIVTIQVRDSRGKSLESLDDSHPSGTIQPIHSHQSFLGGMDAPRFLPMGSKHRSYDDGDITPTNEGLTFETGGTLPRPRGTVKPRPVAKIIAKARGDTNAGVYIEDVAKEEFKKPSSTFQSLPRNPREKEKFLNSDNCDNLWNRTPKKTPPPPPKRTNSVSGEMDVHVKPVQRSDCAVSVNTSALVTVSKSDSMDLPPPPPPHTEQFSVQVSQCEDFPPPPSPLTIVNSERSECGGRNSSSSDNPDTEISVTRCKPKRNGSDASFKSTSSTESDSIPFANENPGTIKQRSSRPHPTISTVDYVSPPQSASPTSSHSEVSSPGSCKSVPQITNEKKMLMRRPGQDPSDVLTDIGSMLADLTDELDAMLELENQHD